jgi:hypothetical protein
MEPKSCADQSSALTESIARYQAGDSQAAAELLTSCEAYLNRWFRLLIQGTFTKNDTEIRQFLGLLSSDLEPALAAKNLARQLRSYSSADLRQEVRALFLQLALEHGEIYAHFPHQLKGRIHVLLGDPLNYQDELGNSTPFGALDEAWVQGQCGNGFSQLTEQQRRIVRCCFWHAYPIPHTAHILKLSVEEIQQELATIRNALKDLNRR